jgi:hypothetical protein
VQIHLHVGLDKAGSSAIQAHINLNRNWFHTNGIIIPQSGFTGSLGHYDLFKDPDGALFESLRKDLDDFSAQGFTKAFISWEGLHALSMQRLEFIRDQLKDHDILPLLYLREQSEILQSGYLQSVKHGRQLLALEQVLGNQQYLCNDSRDYFALLSKLEAVFGNDSTHIRLYDDDTLCEGNVVLDCLQAIGLSLDASFILAPNRQNSSLDLVSTRLLNLLDSYFDDPVGRAVIVDSLLDDINTDTHGGKYFLGQEDQNLIRAYFRISNQKVVEHFLNANHPYPALFPYERKTFRDPQKVEDDIAFQDCIAWLERLTAISVWNGSAMQGQSLTQLAKPKLGWFRSSPEGVWSTGSESILRFKMLRSHLSPFSKTLRLRIKGRYTQKHIATWVACCGLEPARYDLQDTEIEVPIAPIRESRTVELRLSHNAKDSIDGSALLSPSGSHINSLALSDQKRIYLLENLEYTIL